MFTITETIKFQNSVILHPRLKYNSRVRQIEFLASCRTLLSPRLSSVRGLALLAPDPNPNQTPRQVSEFEGVAPTVRPPGQAGDRDMAPPSLVIVRVARLSHWIEGDHVIRLEGFYWMLTIILHERDVKSFFYQIKYF